MKKKNVQTAARGINLLPEKTKREFIRGYYVTFTTLIFALLALVVALGSALLVPSYLLARAEAASLERYLSALEETVGLRERAGAGRAIAELSESIDILSSFEKTRPTADIMVALDRSLPPRVFLQGVSITHFGRNAGEVRVAGIADTRSGLLAFGDALKKNELFQNVMIPVNQLVPEKDVEFSFSFPFDQSTP